MLSGSTVSSITQDCGTWPVFSNRNIVNHLIKVGPTQVFIDKFPEDEKYLHTSSADYSKILSNGEIFGCQWLCYSVSRDSVYSFFYRCFDNKSTYELASDGFNKWDHFWSSEYS